MQSKDPSHSSHILSPWEKYDLGLEELDFIKIIIYEMEKELYYVNE